MSVEPSSDLRSLFEIALNEYEKQAGSNLVEHQLTVRLRRCDSADSVIAVLHEQAEDFLKFRGDDGKVTKWLKRTVHVLHTLSTSGVLCEGIGLPFPPAKAIFAGIGILLAAIKDVSSSYDALVDLFESIENFLRRLDIYTKIPPTSAMTEIIVKILIELLSTLSLATKHVKQGRLKKFGKKLLGENEVEAVLQRLDRLTQEEARATAAQALQVVYGLVKNLKMVIDHGRATADDIHQALVLVQQIAGDINKSKRDQFQESFRRWLSPPDPSINHNIAQKAHHEGTAAWFVQGETFHEWKTTGTLLWMHGNPGSGKSVLCSTIVEDTTRMCEAGLASMAYFYFDFRDKSKQDARALLSSVLIQRSAQSDPCCDILSRLYSANNAGSKQPSEDALKECLKDMLAIPEQGPVFVVIDALDECPQSAGTPSPRESVLDTVQWLVNLRYSHLHVCVSSRPEADIQIVLQTLASHTVSLHNERGQIEDINDFINFFIKSDPTTRKWRKQDQELVISKLSQQAGGMFRWVFCQLDKLRRCLPQRIRRALDELPATLDRTYERTLLDIDEEKWAYAHRLFQCVAVASRPLRVEELAEFLAFDFEAEGSPTFQADWRPEDAGSAVLSTCSSLISVVNVDGTQVVQFSHFSVKEFLTSTRIASGQFSRYYIPFEPAHVIVAQACLSILLQLDNHVTRSSVKKLLLAHYAARHWVNHAKFENVSSYAEHDMKQLFDPGKPHFAAWTWVYNIDPMAELAISENPSLPAASPLYYSALCGFHDVTEWLVTTCSQAPNPRGGYYWTPLHAASVRGYLKTAQLLLGHGANVNDEDEDERIPLHLASWTGRLELCRLLLEHGADINAKDKMLWTPLLLASVRGRLDVAQLLLEFNADANTWSNLMHADTPLYAALQHGHLGLGQLLLEHGADLNAQNNDGQSLLHLASLGGHLRTVQQLLELGANVHVRNGQGQTPFQVVSQHSETESEAEWQREKDEIEQLLLKHGAEGM